MKKFSTSWKSSKLPRKQRKYRDNAHLHVAGSMIVSRLAKAVSERYNRRNIPIRKGDIIKILRGKFRGKTGTIEDVNHITKKVFVSGIEQAKREGQKRMVPIDPSNVMITELNMEERKRQKIISRTQQK